VTHKITPGLPGAGRVNTEFIWTDESRVQDEIVRLQSQIELQTAYAEKWRKRANRLAEKLELIELRRENEELRRQVARVSETS
jgi:hypothetical protein